MRVVVLGDDMMVRRLSASLARQGIEVVGTVPVLGEEGFDLVVVDSLEEEAETACRRIKQTRGVPVVLMVRGRQTDWDKLQSLDTDAYIPEGVSGAELAARLRAVVRRRSGKKSIRKGKKHETVGGN